MILALWRRIVVFFLPARRSTGTIVKTFILEEQAPDPPREMIDYYADERPNKRVVDCHTLGNFYNDHP
jgi:hypothetical protein